MNNDSHTGLSLSESFLRAMAPPLEADIYQSHMKQALWSIDEFSALMAGLTPENYKKGTKGSTLITDEIFVKREAFATQIFSQFLDYMGKNHVLEDFTTTDENMYMSSWKFIKWIALHNIPLKNRFFNSLPFTLMELFIEFQPINVDLRTAPLRSLAYHKALYLQHAQKLLKENPDLKPMQIYKDPRMQNIQRYIRELGGNYKKRTFLDSWLPEIIVSPIGRPKKTA